MRLFLRRKKKFIKLSKQDCTKLIAHNKNRQLIYFPAVNNENELPIFVRSILQSCILILYVNSTFRFPCLGDMNKRLHSFLGE